MRSQDSHRPLVRDRRRRSWIAVCPTAEFILPGIDERRAELASFITARPSSKSAGRSSARLNGTDAFALTLIAGFYGSLLFCLVTIVH